MKEYWNEAAGKYILPAGAEWAQVVYDHGTGPQVTNVVRLDGESDADAAERWRVAREGEWGYPIEVIVASDDEAVIERARNQSLFDTLPT
jgi:hypothetical protein